MMSLGGKLKYPAYSQVFALLQDAKANAVLGMLGISATRESDKNIITE